MLQLTSRHGCRFPLPLPQEAHIPLQHNDPSPTSKSERIVVAINETDVRPYVQTSCYAHWTQMEHVENQLCLP